MTTGRRSLLGHADKLGVLEALVSAGSFRRAAAVLRVTPSAVSQSITALEAVVRQPLVVRSRHHVALTPWGEDLLRRAKPALDVLRSIDDPAPSIDRRIRIRLGAYESIAVYAVPGLLGRLGARHPNVTMTLRTGRSGVLMKLVRRGDLDAALVAENDLVGQLDSVELARDRLGLFAAPNHDALTTGVTRAMPFAGLAAGVDGVPRYYKSFLRAYGLGHAPLIECDSFEALRMMAVRLMPAILPERVALRAPDELKPVPAPKGARPDAGAHAILLVTRRGVGDDARDLLAGELRLLLG